jgi:hypothetical protein
MFERFAHLLIALTLCACAAAVQAVPFQVFSRAALGGNEFFDWAGIATVGPGDDVLPGTTLQSSGGTVQAMIGSTPVGRSFQGTTWNGNFAPGDAVLSLRSSAGILAIVFDVPVRGFGTQIQGGNAFGPFTATVDIHDVNSTICFACFSVTGNSTSAGDNSAVFIGALDTAFSIARVDFRITSDSSGSTPGGALVGINRLDIVTPAATGGQASEPAPLALLALALLVLPLATRSRTARL